MSPADTIVAISSVTGYAARLIVRVSGPNAVSSAALIGLPSDSTGASRVELRFANLSCPAWVYVFKNPKSYTGEDLVEFHLPGNPVLARLLLDDLIRNGLRQADAGEFTARAYFNGRLDLTEAEGVAATIHAQNASELHVARQLLAGELSRRLRPITDLLTETLALVEVAIDFTEEDVTFLSEAHVRARVAQADDALADLLRGSVRFEKLSHEPRVVLVGRPNAGKSTLLNALSRSDRAVVSSTPGTTRDAIWATVALPRGMVRVIDVAGLDTPGDDTIDRQMQARAARTIEEADVVVLVHSLSDASPLPQIGRTPDLLVRTKRDLQAPPSHSDSIDVSAKNGVNLNALRRALDTIAFGPERSTPSELLALNARHVRALDRTREVLAGVTNLPPDTGPEFIAADLREALDELGQVLGVISPDDVLGKIFSAFCIGK